MKIRGCLLLFCRVLFAAGMASAVAFEAYSLDGGERLDPWRIRETKSGGIVVGPTVTDRCFRYGSGRKIVRDRRDKLHVVYVDPYPSDPRDIPPSDGPYQSCTYAFSTDQGVTWERTFLDADYFIRYPAIAIHGDTLHVIYANWESFTSYSNIEYTRSTDRGETWTEPINITPTEYLAGDCDYAGLDVDLDGNPHVSFVWPPRQAVYWTMSSDAGETWTTPEQVSYGYPSGTIGFTNVVINPHTNLPHIFFNADASPWEDDYNYYHSFYLDGKWSYPTENITRHPANDAFCYGCGSLVFDADATQYTAYFFVDDRAGWSGGTFYQGIGVYRRTDFSTNLGEDGDIWGEPLVVADRSEPQFESCPWYPSAVINPGSNPGSADDDTIFCVFATGAGEDSDWHLGDVFIKHSTDRGLTWLDDWHRNPLTTDGDSNYDNWPEVDWGHWSRGHLDVVWVAKSHGGYEVHYADAYLPVYPYDAAVVAVDLPSDIRVEDRVEISATVENRGTLDLLFTKVLCSVRDSVGAAHFLDSAEIDFIFAGEMEEVTFPNNWDVTESGLYAVVCSAAIEDSLLSNNAYTLWVRVLTESVGDGPLSLALPLDYVLHQNYPNPFNSLTEIAYSLPRGQEVTLVVYDVLGRCVRTLVEGPRPAGRHKVRWDGRDDGGNAVGSGVYLCRLEAGGCTLARRMILLK